jgi:hypothetical protein
MAKIQDGVDPRWRRSKMAEIQDGGDPRLRRSKMASIQDGEDPRWRRSKMAKIQGGEDPRWRRFKDGGDPRWRRSKMAAKQKHEKKKEGLVLVSLEWAGTVLPREHEARKISWVHPHPPPPHPPTNLVIQPLLHSSRLSRGEPFFSLYLWLMMESLTTTPTPFI